SVAMVRSTIGTAKARVLPDPVGDLASTSSPASASGRTSAWIGNGSWMERVASTPAMSEDTPSSRKDWCCMLFDSFTGSRLAYLETPEGGTRSSSHRAAELPTRGHTVAAERRANPSTGGDPHPEPRRFSEDPRSI